MGWIDSERTVLLDGHWRAAFEISIYRCGIEENRTTSGSDLECLFCAFFLDHITYV